MDAGSLFAVHYVAEARLGAGGAATVWQVRDLRTGQRRALKLLSSSSRDARARLLREGDLLASLQHDCVVKLIEQIEVGGVPALMLELVDGPSLAALLRTGPPLLLPQIDALARDLFAGVGALHAAGLIHRDLKPGNLLLARSDGGPRLKVSDLGLAKAVADTAAALTVTGEALGTVAYMAPEQLRETRSVDHRADLWAVGCVLYAMCCGREAFCDEDAFAMLEDIVQGRFTPPRTLRPDLPGRWADAICDALVVTSDQRIASIEDLARRWGPPLSAAGWPVSLCARQQPRPPLRLPPTHDAFIGRGPELVALAAALGDGGGLWSVVGTGGTGKTRLVTQLAWRVHASMPGGSWFIDLSEARTVDGVCAVLAEALDVPLGRQEPLAQLGTALRGRGRCLLVLDNFEQLIDHAQATVGAWVAAAPEAVVVVTSRTPLGLPGETTFSLEPLPVDSDAIALFLTRARQRRPGLDVGPGERRDIAAITALLDGLPLAIELAAGRITLMSVRKLRQRLSDRFRLLRGTRGTTTARHATLRAALDWSWNLLEPHEQDCLAQLSVFEGGWRPEDAEQVVSLDVPVGPTIEALTSKSLVRAGSRGRLLRSIQEYAAEKLSPDARAGAERRHGRCFAVHGTQEAIDSLEKHGGVSRERALHAELDNLSAAARRAVQRGEAEVAADCALAAAAVYLQRGPLALGIELLEAARPLRGPWTPRLLRSLGNLLQSVGRSDESRACLDEALALATEQGDTRLTGRIHTGLSHLSRSISDLDAAHAHTTEALRIFEAHNDPWLAAMSLNNAGLIAYLRGESEAAVALLERSLPLHRQEGNRTSEGRVLGNLGVMYKSLGRLEDARAHSAAALVIHQETGNRTSEARVCNHLGQHCARDGDTDQATVFYRRSLRIAEEIGSPTEQPPALNSLGNLARRRGDLDEAADFYERAVAISQETGDRRTPAVVLKNLAAVSLDRGRPREAIAQLQEAIALRRAIGAGHTLVVPLSELGRVHVSLDQPAEAGACFAEAAALLTDRPDPGEEALLHTRMAARALRLGQLEDAHTHQDAAEARAPEPLPEVLLGRAHLALQDGDRDTAAASLAQLTDIMATQPILGQWLIEAHRALLAQTAAGR